ncbi:hypothetical protein GOP47_0005473 [Adiantum capillus-veneris]|uniref:Uncharacterized protein n=1 Tax=Adiantum capillus-veneris TaxID=13818 RepID=A0A9D4V569_ADICA|nr:hypothetical protein GOP47_0005473 [Adiantum capillus-veneris]
MGAQLSCHTIYAAYGCNFATSDGGGDDGGDVNDVSTVVTNDVDLDVKEMISKSLGMLLRRLEFGSVVPSIPPLAPYPPLFLPRLE